MDDIGFGYDEPDWGLIPETPMPDFGTSPDLGSYLGDPYGDWGGGQGGDGTDGSGDWGGLGSGLASGLASILKGAGGLLGGGGLSGLLGNKDLLSLLALLGGGAATLNNNNANKDAVKQLQDAANASNDKANELIGGAMGNFTPYISAGQNALGGLTSLANSDNSLAGKFGNVKDRSGSGIRGASTMKELAKR